LLLLLLLLLRRGCRGRGRRRQRRRLGGFVQRIISTNILFHRTDFKPES